MRSPQDTMSLAPEISVVAPCHNESGNIPALAEGVRAALEPSGRPYEIVLVDDRSTDRSWETIRELGERDPRVRGLRFAENRGQSAALWAGMKAARGRIIVTLDADLQNPPAEIPRFLAAPAATTGCDASRRKSPTPFATGSAANRSATRGAVSGPSGASASRR